LGSNLGFLLKKNNKMDGFECAFEKLTQSFIFDLSRKNSIITEQDIINRVHLLGDSVIEIIELCFDSSLKIKRPLKKHLNNVYIYLDILLDLEEDFEIGYINIPKKYIDDIYLSKEDVRQALIRKESDITAFIKEAVKEIEISFTYINQNIPNIKPFLFSLFLRKMYKQKYRKFIVLKQRWAIS
ncbi:MAG: hypothetical protein KAR54_01530, partial [Candidatus Pacebacteria bacterium]|nr:hypothetical protein [Candidatus Paceibacterota bacterium]